MHGLLGPHSRGLSPDTFHEISKDDLYVGYAYHYIFILYVSRNFAPIATPPPSTPSLHQYEPADQ